jgi:hypothetical protein
MSMSVQVGLLLAVATAFASVVGFLYKHRGAVESPAVELRRPVRTSLALFRSRWYTLGILIAMAGWGFHVGALALAPISLVQSVIAGGLVLLTVTADRLFAHEVTRREWIGVALAALGLAFLAATLEGTGTEAHADYEPARLLTYLIAVIGAALAVAFAARGAAGLRAQPSGRQGSAGDRGDQRRSQRAHDRRRAARLRGAVPGRAARRTRAAERLHARDRRRGPDPSPGQGRASRAGVTQTRPAYQRPKLTPKMPKAGISTVR